MDSNNGIGISNKLPWNIKEEMNHFRNTTSFSVIVMGKKTFTSIGRPLPKRLNIVLSQDLVQTNSYLNTFKNETISFFSYETKIDSVIQQWNEKKNTAIYCSSLQDVVEYDKKNPEQILYIIGGKQIYELFFPYTDIFIVSVIKNNYQCDTFLSSFNQNNYDLEKEYKFDEFDVKFYVNKKNNKDKKTLISQYLKKDYAS